MPKVIGREAVQALVRRGAQLVDVLPREEYERVHIAGAINLPLTELDARSAARLDLSHPVVVYCEDFQ